MTLYPCPNCVSWTEHGAHEDGSDYEISGYYCRECGRELSIFDAMFWRTKEGQKVAEQMLDHNARERDEEEERNAHRNPFLFDEVLF